MLFSGCFEWLDGVSDQKENLINYLVIVLVIAWSHFFRSD
jgi:hypothetical protein